MLYDHFPRLPLGRVPHKYMAANLRLLISELRTSPTSHQLTQQQRQDLIANLPRLQEAEIISSGQQDSLCPICFTSVLALLAEEETAFAMESPAHPPEELGVTRLAQTWQCGHVFCRRDISKWIRDGHDSCPTCRRLLVEPSNATSANGPAAEGREELEIADLDALFAQLHDLTILPSFAPGSLLIPADITSEAGGPENGQSRRNHDERDDYVGMYS